MTHTLDQCGGWEIWEGVCCLAAATRAVQLSQPHPRRPCSLAHPHGPSLPRLPAAIHCLAADTRGALVRGAVLLRFHARRLAHLQTHPPAVSPTRAVVRCLAHPYGAPLLCCLLWVVHVLYRQGEKGGEGWANKVGGCLCVWGFLALTVKSRGFLMPAANAMRVPRSPCRTSATCLTYMALHYLAHPRCPHVVRRWCACASLSRVALRFLAQYAALHSLAHPRCPHVVRRWCACAGTRIIAS